MRNLQKQADPTFNRKAPISEVQTCNFQTVLGQPWADAFARAIFQRLETSLSSAMSVSDVGSWLETNHGTYIATRCSRLRACGAELLAWWRDTTDVVVLSSPWLRRGTGRFCRCVFILAKILTWLLSHGFDYAPLRWNDQLGPFMRYRNIALFCVMSFCLAASLWTSLRTSQESLRGSFLFGVGMTISFELLVSYALWLPGEMYFPVAVAVMCHCNVHPLVLTLMIGYHFATIIQIMMTLLDVQMQMWKYSPQLLHLTAFEFILLAAFTWDFTQRVKAVCSGILFGENDEVLRSPVAGRSARSLCWLSGVNQWILWGTFIFYNVRAANHEPAIFKNHLPVSSFAIPFLAIGFVVLSLWRKQRPSSCQGSYMTSAAWYEDFALAFFCCAPAVLLMVDIRFSHMSGKPKPLIWYQYMEESVQRGFLLFIAAVQTLIQAGCHPLICSLATACLTASSFWMWPFELITVDTGLDTLDSSIIVSPVISFVFISWSLVVSHLIDFFARMRAIQRGMQQSRRNAASSLMLISSERMDGLELPHVQPHVQHLQREEAMPQSVSPDLSAPALTSKRRPSAVVAVVRHAERADNTQTFDGWGCSQDAHDFPHDPPITARGVEQAQQLADELKMEEMDFDVIVSSPFLRCLQTALILAEHFDATVLIDQELGEVMGPPIFETEPPLPPRPWSKLKATLKASTASNFHEHLRAGCLMGKRPQWAESIQQARLRYVKRYLDYLRRSHRTKKNCLLVTHGHMVQACATVLPANQHRKVVSVDYCGAAVAECHKLGKNEQLEGFFPARAASFDSGKEQVEQSDLQNLQSDLHQKNQLIRDAKMKYWTLWLRGVRTVPSSRPSNASHLSQSLGQSWQDLVKVLGVLPPVGRDDAESHVDMRSESACSLGTRSNATATTTVSTKMLREPDSVPLSPKIEAKEREEVKKVKPEAPMAAVPAPKLKPVTSRLAARRGFSKPSVPATVAEDQA